MPCLGGCFAPGVVGEGAPPAAPAAARAGWAKDAPGAAPAARDVDAQRDATSRRSKTKAAAAQPGGEAAERDALRGYLRQHGRGILAVSTLQQDNLHYHVLPGVGYIAYAWMHNGPPFLNIRSAVALSDPICDPSHWRDIAAGFLEAHPKAMFAQVSPAFAEVLQGLGMYINSMGGETRLDLATYNFTGYAKRGLKSAIASAVKEGVVVEEVMPAPADGGAPHAADWSGLAAEMREVDACWQSAKGAHAGDVWFINRLPVFAPEPGVRKFVARDAAGVLQGFIFFDAVFEAGAITGYYANVTRMRPEAHAGTLNLIMREFINRVRSETQLAAPERKLSMRRSQRRKLEAAAAAAAAAGGAVAPAGEAAAAAGAGAAVAPAGPRFVSLGLSPLCQMDDRCFRHSPRVKKLYEAMFEHGAFAYPFKTLAHAKAKYGAGLHAGVYEDPAVTYQQAYLAHRHHRSAPVTLFDLGVLFGFWRGPLDAGSALLSYKAAQGAARLKRQASRLRSRSSSSARSCPSSVPRSATPSVVDSTGQSAPAKKLAQKQAAAKQAAAVPSAPAAGRSRSAGAAAGQVAAQGGARAGAGAPAAGAAVAHDLGLGRTSTFGESSSGGSSLIPAATSVLSSPGVSAPASPASSAGSFVSASGASLPDLAAHAAHGGSASGASSDTLSSASASQ